MRNRKLWLLSTLVLLSLSSGVYAAPGSGAVLPSSGAALDAARQPQVETQKAAPSITVPESTPSSTVKNGNLEFTAREYDLAGDVPGDKGKLTKILDAYKGKKISLNKLNSIADELSTSMHKQGYMLAQAYVPPQEITGGKVKLEILPGRYGKLLLQGDTPVSPKQIRGIMATAKEGNLVYKPKLERQLLLLNDLTGMSANATLEPGSKLGESNLVVTVRTTAKNTGLVYVDNYGNRHSGHNRLGIIHHFNNIGGRGDQLTLSGLSSFSDLNNWQVDYATPLNNQGTTLEVSVGKVQYNIGSREFAALDAYGDALTASAMIKHPVQKSLRQQTYFNMGYEYKRLRDKNIADDNKKQNRIFSLGLSGNLYDSFLGGGYNSYSLTQSFGNLSGNLPDEDDLNTLGSYSKTQAYYYRNQRLSDRLSLHLELLGQFSSRNLDSSEKLYISGPMGVRAYGQGELGGDRGILSRNELRYLLNKPTSPTKFYLGGFYDIGSVKYNHDNVYGVNNSDTAKGAGISLLVTHKDNLSLHLDYAWKIGSLDDEDGDNGRIWAQLMYSY